MFGARALRAIRRVGEAQGKVREAEELYREALEGRRLTLGPAHPMTIRSMNNLANLLDSEAQRAHQQRRFSVLGLITASHNSPVVMVSVTPWT